MQSSQGEGRRHRTEGQHWFPKLSSPFDTQEDKYILQLSSYFCYTVISEQSPLLHVCDPATLCQSCCFHARGIFNEWKVKCLISVHMSLAWSPCDSCVSKKNISCSKVFPLVSKPEGRFVQRGKPKGRAKERSAGFWASQLFGNWYSCSRKVKPPH